MKPALILIDLQEDYLARKELAPRKDALLGNVGKLLAAFRSLSLPIVHVISIYRKDRSNWTLSMIQDNWPVVIEGTPGAKVAAEVRPLPGEPVVVKDRYSAFFRTDMDERLKAMGATDLVLAGINTHACIRTTAIDAFMRDWKVILPLECVDSWDPDHHRITVEYFRKAKIARIVPLEDFLAEIGSSGERPGSRQR